jgi:hypothetical protein
MDARVSFSGWSPIDRLHRSRVARLFAIGFAAGAAGQEAS